MVSGVRDYFEGSIRPLQARYLSERVDYCVLAGPGYFRRVRIWPSLNVVRGVIQDEVAVRLIVSAKICWFVAFKVYLGKTVPIKYKSV